MSVDGMWPGFLQRRAEEDEASGDRPVQTYDLPDSGAATGYSAAHGYPCAFGHDGAKLYSAWTSACSRPSKKDIAIDVRKAAANCSLHMSWSRSTGEAATTAVGSTCSSTTRSIAPVADFFVGASGYLAAVEAECDDDEDGNLFAELAAWQNHQADDYPSSSDDTEEEAYWGSYCGGEVVQLDEESSTKLRVGSRSLAAELHRVPQPLSAEQAAKGRPSVLRTLEMAAFRLSLLAPLPADGSDGEDSDGAGSYWDAYDA
eukprot:TRINITY_DN76434_c0_g1_i1.p1 TRINITY_DN76434_c0_g1~~TRINITY_DN76434_c0_g1_i1.p1  ORF type:complete len:259 (-),score=50.01 TRINITY_DN76434_c0_g1_i1:94-870(-)